MKLMVFIAATLGLTTYLKAQNAFYAIGQVDVTYTTKDEGPADINSLYFYENSNFFYQSKEVLLALEAAPATYTIKPNMWFGLGARLFDNDESGGNLELTFGKLSFSTTQFAATQNESAIFTMNGEEWRYKFRLNPFFLHNKITVRAGVGFTGGFAKILTVGLSLPERGYYNLYPANATYQKRDFSFLFSLGAGYAITDRFLVALNFDTFSVSTQKEDLSNSGGFLGATGPARYNYHRFRCFSFGLQVQYRLF
jgi:hypothetical protein